jgi:hypothetical protein
MLSIEAEKVLSVLIVVDPLNDEEADVDDCVSTNAVAVGVMEDVGVVSLVPVKDVWVGVRDEVSSGIVAVLVDKDMYDVDTSVG